MSGPVSDRLFDREQKAELHADLQALATTGMATETIARLLADDTDRKAWEVGEALAECLLQDIRGVIWPGNKERDKRTPKASLPGADLVGLTNENGCPVFLFGEVKTSSDTGTPPNVMLGKGGMTHQLDEIACTLQIHFCLVNYLHTRCKNTEFWPVFQEAARKYIDSGGRTVLLVGLLMRDTTPDVRDLQGRGEHLAGRLSSPARLELQAWYLPRPIEKWVELGRGGDPA